MSKRFLTLFLLIAILLSGCSTAVDQQEDVLCENHSDANRNGMCDFCGQLVAIFFDFYSINDLHGKFEDGDNHPGVDELTTYFEYARIRDDNVVILSAGDMWQGSAESNLTNGMIMTDWMNQIGVTAMSMGNHEFDWGETYIEENEKLAEFPFLAINIYERATNTLVDYCQPSVVVEGDGIQIGIIGAIGDCYDDIALDKVEDIYFKTGSELTSLVKKESERLRGEGVDFIVYVLHDGYGNSAGTTSTVVSSSQMKSYYDIALSDGYVDLVFEGHTHQGYVIMDQQGVYHLQNRGDNKGGISHVEVAFNIVTGDCSISVSELVSTDSYANLADDPVVNELLIKYEEQIAPGKQVLGNNGRRRSSEELRQTVADLYYQTGLAKWGDDYKITLGGGFLQTRSPYNLASGEVKYSQLIDLFPFDNELVLCSIKGRDLLSKFVNTSNDKYFISGDQTLMNNVDPDGTYYIVVDTYTAVSKYAPKSLTVVEKYTTGIYARDLLAEYIRQGGLQ